jgi:transcriptional regulator GlxA family with amidase domain
LTGEPLHKPLEITAPIDLRSSTCLGQMLDYFLDELDREQSVFETHPLAGQEFQRTLIAAVIQQTPSNYHHLLGRQHGGSAQRHVTKAAEFIEAHLHGPLTIGDIAHAVGVSVRTLRESCNRRYDITPEELVRRMRLHVVHRRLEKPEPRDTVASVAREYGFTNPSRFSYHYRREFHDESPGETLLRGRKRLRLSLTPGQEG